MLERLKIPRGSEPNSVLKFKGKGKSIGSKIGDLYVKLVNKLNGERKDNDFYTSERISIADVHYKRRRPCWAVTCKLIRSSEVRPCKCLKPLDTGRSFLSPATYIGLEVGL